MSIHFILKSLMCVFKFEIELRIDNKIPCGRYRRAVFVISVFHYTRLSFYYGSRFVRDALGCYDNLFDGLVRRNVKHYLCYRALDY